MCGVDSVISHMKNLRPERGSDLTEVGTNVQQSQPTWGPLGSPPRPDGAWCSLAKQQTDQKILGWGVTGLLRYTEEEVYT